MAARDDLPMRDAIDDAVSDLECLEAAMMRCLSPDRDEHNLVLEHFLKSVASIRASLEARAREAGFIEG